MRRRRLLLVVVVVILDRLETRPGRNFPVPGRDRGPDGLRRRRRQRLFRGLFPGLEPVKLSGHDVVDSGEALFIVN